MWGYWVCEQGPADCLGGEGTRAFLHVWMVLLYRERRVEPVVLAAGHKAQAHMRRRLASCRACMQALLANFRPCPLAP